MKRRNAIARDLRSPSGKYRPRVVRSRKVYTRKVKHRRAA
jgi:mRNA-degrading endonuclease toxin of MazEF toxin-antitoxin module